jgi:hypothetical protein
MDRRFVIGLTVVAILVACAWGLTQAQQPGGKQPPASDQFLVSPAGETAVLLDAKSGKTWVLSRAIDGESVWLPAKRIDSPDEAQAWREVQKRRAQELGLKPKE